MLQILINRYKAYLLFFAIAFILYGNTLRNGYGLDDGFVTEHNITNQGFRSIKKIFTTYYVTNEGDNNYEYRPIVKLSFAIEHQFFGVNTAVGHFFNVFLYAVCLCILFNALLRILSEQGRFFCLITVILFAFIPVHSEVVASLKNRDILLCFIFSWLAFLYFDNYFKTKKPAYILAAFLCILTACLSKLDSLSCLILFPFLFYKKRLLNLKGLLLLAGSFVVAYICFKLMKLGLVAQHASQRSYGYFENPLYFNHSVFVKLSAALNCLGYYTRQLFVPIHMVSYYGYDTLPIFSFTSGYAMMGMLLLLACTIVFFRFLKKESHPLWIGVLFFLCHISIYLNIIQPAPGIIADRFLFSASIGFCIVITYLLFAFINKQRFPKMVSQTSNTFRMVFLIFCLLSAGIIVSRNREWKDRLTLFKADIEKEPRSVKLSLLYATEMLVIIRNQQRADHNQAAAYFKKAEDVLTRALAIDPDNASVLNNLAYIRLSYYKDYNSALSYSLKAYQIDSSKFETLYNIAYCSYKISKFKDAEDFVLRAYNANHDGPLALNLMAAVFTEANDTGKGISFLQKKQRDNPRDNRITIMIGNLYIAGKDSAAAKAYYEKALAQDPQNGQLIEITRRLSKY